MVHTAGRVPIVIICNAHTRICTLRLYPKCWCHEQTSWRIVEWKPEGKRGAARPKGRWMG